MFFQLAPLLLLIVNFGLRQTEKKNYQMELIALSTDTSVSHVDTITHSFKDRTWEFLLSEDSNKNTLGLCFSWVSHLAYYARSFLMLQLCSSSSTDFFLPSSVSEATSILISAKSSLLTAFVNCIQYVYDTVDLPSDFLLQIITWAITPLPSTAHSLLILKVTASKSIFMHIHP